VHAPPQKRPVGLARAVADKAGREGWLMPLQKGLRGEPAEGELKKSCKTPNGRVDGHEWVSMHLPVNG